MNRDLPSGGGFGTLLRRYRSASALTQEELAELSGLSVRAIADMERGRTARPNRGSVRLLADALALPGPEREELVRAARFAAAGGGPAGGGPAGGGPAGGGPAGDTSARGDTRAPGPSSVRHATGGHATGRHTTGGHAAGGVRPAPVVPRELPPAIPHFAGRTAELDTLTGLLDTTRAAGGTLPALAIAGTAGVGKTALALHWAHQVADRFGDGQLYVNLRGFDPSGLPLVPAEAIRGFLDALGVPSPQIPATTQAQAGLYRSLLASRKVLILLDNARDPAQVRPLLPGNPACLAVITSRSQLAGLAAADGARPLFLGQLTSADAAELLARRLGRERLAAEPRAAGELVGLCARLPLALAIAAARAAEVPSLTLRELAADLGAAAGRLDVMETGEAATSLRAVFSWSYQLLSEPAARLFRLLGVHPGPDITAAAAASLAGITLAQSRALLRELASCHLVAQEPPGRYAFHDMLRVYAAELAGSADSEAERRGAMHRVLDHYLHTCHGAARLIFPGSVADLAADPAPGTAPERLPERGQALAWCQAERRVLMAAVAAAGSGGFDTHAWQIPWTLAAFLDLHGYWHDYQDSQQIALAAAQREGNAAAMARAQRHLGGAMARLGRHHDARLHQEQALGTYRGLRDDVGQARVHSDIAWVLELQGSYHEALAHARQSLGLFQAAGHSAGQARALQMTGWYHALSGDPQPALDYCQRSLDLSRKLGLSHHEAHAWDSLGYAHLQLGDHASALPCFRRALALNQQVGDQFNQSQVLAHLGDACRASGDMPAARDFWQRAVAILDELHHRDAEQVRAKLSQLAAAAGQVRSGPASLR